MKSPRPAPLIELLEPRVAPAVIVNPTTVTYTDLDGDPVMVQITKGTLTADDFVFDSDFASSGPQQLLRIDLAGDTTKAKSDLTINIGPVPVGDGFANIGYIDATGIDLRDVIVMGDLGRIDAGDAVKSTPGIRGLMVGSFGVQPIASTQEAGGNLVSTIVGPVSVLTVAGDISGALLDVGGSINTIEISGDLLGGTDAMSGSVRSKGSISQAHIGGNIVGGDGDNSGQLFARHNVDALTLDGSLIGGTLAGSLGSGQIAANDRIGQVMIGGSIQGGAGDQSAQIAARDGLSSVAVAGSLTGGDGLESGVIGSRGKIASVTLKMGMAGGVGLSSGSILADATIQSVEIGDSQLAANITGGAGERSGIVASTKGIKSVVVHGSIIGGGGDTAGAIGSTKALGTIQIDGDLQGGTGPRSGEVVSSAALGEVTVNGSVFGGAGDESGAIGSTGPMQSVMIAGNFSGSSGFNAGWIVSGATIGSITIGGSASTSGFSSGILESKGRISSISVGGDIGNVEGNPSRIFAGSIGTLDVTGSILSGSSFQEIISARKSIGTINVGQDVTGTARSFSHLTIRAGTFIDTISISGSISFSDIVIGAGAQGETEVIPANPDARLGTMTVGGNWLSTSVAVGTFAGSDGLFGTPDDTISHGGNPSVFGTIEKIAIGGSASVGSGQTFDAAGIVAELIKSLTIGKAQIALKAGALNDLVNIDPAGGNFFAREIPFSKGPVSTI